MVDTFARLKSMLAFTQFWKTQLFIFRRNCNKYNTLYTQRKFFWILLNYSKISLRLIWNQTEFRLVPDRSENGKYNLSLVWFNKIQKMTLCVYKIYTQSIIYHDWAMYIKVAQRRYFMKPSQPFFPFPAGY